MKRAKTMVVTVQQSQACAKGIDLIGPRFSLGMQDPLLSCVPVWQGKLLPKEWL